MPSGDTALQIWQLFNPRGLPWVLVVVVATVVVVRLLGAVAARFAARMPSQRLLIKKANTLLAFVVYLGAGTLVANTLFHWSDKALFALSGALAVAVGFALKDVAASIFAGVTILVTKPFQVGDRIHFGGYYGEVKEIGLRTVRLVTLDDNLVTLPSNRFLTESVASATGGTLDSMVVIPFYLRGDADFARAKEIVGDAVLASQYLYLGKPLTVLVSNLIADDANSVIELRAKAYVYDTRYERAFASDVTERVLGAFQREGVLLSGVHP